MTASPTSRQPYPWLGPGVLAGALVPLAAIAIHGLRGTLGANPIAQALNQFGLVALIFLVAALACTPAKLLFGWTWPLRIRRLLGLLGFFYACLHVATYVGVDQFFDWPALWNDVTERNFIVIGLAAFVLLIPLGVTSTRGAVQRLGFARWKRLHRLAYVVPALSTVHFFWRVKKDTTEPLAYAGVIAALLGIRLLARLRSRPGTPARIVALLDVL